MKVYLSHPIPDSIAIDRVLAALAEYAPRDIEIIPEITSADLVIFNINGRHDQFTRKINDLTNRGKAYAVIQYVLRGSRNTSTADWLPLWNKAKLVFSYYDLKALCKEDGISPDFNFYHAPLGVDPVFKETPSAKKYIIATSGNGYLTESARECILAANAVNKPVFHIGPAITDRSGVDFSQGINDSELAKKYSACQFVSGLRRCEGFELPVIEGLMCGARPICFDRPHYRKWFNEWAIFIKEESRPQVIDSLIKVFQTDPKPVSATEKNAVKKIFNWETIIKRFWSLCV
jgi:hypothetical protein